MRESRLIFAILTILMTSILSLSSFAQTEDYSCNVIYGDQINFPLSGVQVDLYNINNEIIGTTYSEDDGFFTFDDLLIGESYTARFSYDAEADFVDLEDAFTLLYYLLGWVELSELQILAADVDANNQIDIYDFIHIIYYYVYELPFPAGDWVFPDWTFEMTADKLTGGPAGGIGVADISGGLGKANTSIQLDYDELVSFKTTELVIPIYFNETISTNGVGLVLGYNSELIEVTKIESSIEDLEYSIKDGIIRMAWVDVLSYKFTQEEPIVMIHIKQNLALSNGQIESFELLEGTQILNKSGKKYPFINFTSSEFKLSDATTLTSSVSESAYPNPCRESFTISIENQESNTADIQIYNTLGQLVKSEYLYVSNEKLIINTQELNAGIYIYHINIQSKLISGTISIRK